MFHVAKRVPGIMLFLLICSLTQALPIRIIATGDTHGWLRPTIAEGQTQGGVAEMLAYWREHEDYAPEKYLLLGCGDMVTGVVPISMLFLGEPVIEAMNSMGYDATVLGNHDFDFTPRRLAMWSTQAKFPFLAANLGPVRDLPPESVKPYLIDESQGVKIGIVGLTLPGNLILGSREQIASAPSEATLRRVAAELRAEGVQTIIVLSHLAFKDLSALAERVPDLNIPLMLGGHDHEFSQRKIGRTWVVNSGAYWQGYTRIDLDFNPESGTTTVITAKQITLQQESPTTDAALKAQLDYWHIRLDMEYAAEIAYSARGLTMMEMGNFVTTCWQQADPQAQLALSNTGSMRDMLMPGAVTLRRLFGIMPFDYSVLRVTMPGDKLREFVTDRTLYISGLRRQDTRVLLSATGKELEPNTRYQVLMNNYMYVTSSSLQAIDANPTVVFDDWRLPVLNWLAANPSSPELPLEDIIANRK